MAITTPYSLELTQDQDAKDAVAGTLVDVVSFKMKIFLGGNVDPAKRQQYVGVLRNVFNKLLNDRGSDTGSGARVAYANWQSGSNGNVTIDAGTAGVTADDVAVVTAGNFRIDRSHMADETFKQLINVLLEKTKGN